MKATVTFEDDVAKVLRPQAAAYETPAVDLGRCLVGSLDDVGEALALAEGDDSR